MSSHKRKRNDYSPTNARKDARAAFNQTTLPKLTAKQGLSSLMTPDTAGSAHDSMSDQRYGVLQLKDFPEGKCSRDSRLE
jgi:hypothetical protein